MLPMLRLTAGAAVIFCAGAALAQAPTSEYFPTKKAKWVYKVADQEITVEVGDEVMVGADKGVKFITKVGGQEKTTEVYVVKADGVYRAKVKDDDIVPPVKILPNGKIDKDATWDVNSKVGNQTVSGKFKVVAVGEKIKTPAGDFDTVVVEGKDFEIAGSKATVKQWFAKDRGIVKSSYLIQNTENVLELKEYVPEGK